uniref:Interleukin-12 subunit alpha n=1 Tax=Hucho hucho TaxID=62062 RepID=A0A4W5P2D9_9TELE
IVSSLHTDLASCVLLLALSCQVSMGTPMRTPPSLDSAKCSQCADLSRELVKNVRKLLDNENLFGGLNCSEQRVEVNSKTQTVLACEPNPDRVSHTTVIFYIHITIINLKKDNFSDLQNSDINQSIGALFCFLFPFTLQVADPKLTSGDTVDQRVHLCKVLKGFHLRVITISRAMGYISAGDHRK